MAAFSVPISMAAAPSFKPDEFPAVTDPPSFLKAALNVPNFSKVVDGLINSSLARDLKIKKFYLSSSAYSRRLSTFKKD